MSFRHGYVLPHALPVCSSPGPLNMLAVKPGVMWPLAVGFLQPPEARRAEGRVPQSPLIPVRGLGMLILDVWSPEP